MSRLAFAPVVALCGSLACPRTVIAQPRRDPSAEEADAREVEARVRHEAGVALMLRGRQNPTVYNAALAEFERAYQLLEGHPGQSRELLNVAQCRLEMGQGDLAVEAYRRYLREGSPDAADRAEIEARVAQIEGTLGVVEVLANVGDAEIWVDDRLVGRAPRRVYVSGGGQRVIEVRARGYAPSRRASRVVSRQRLTLRFELEPLGRRGLGPVYFWVAAGLAGGAAVTGAVFGARALSEREDLDARLASPDDADRFLATQADGESIRALSLTADVFFGGAALFAVTAAVLGFVTDFHRPARASRAWTLSPLRAGTARGAALVVGF